MASAEALPVRDRSVDAALAILTLHHWPDWRAGLRDMARASRRLVVVLTWDPATEGFWLTDDYFPEIVAIDRIILPSISQLAEVLGPVTVQAVPIPHDCTDGFLCAYWRRPRAYLDPRARAAISAFAKLPSADTGLQRLAADLDSGDWHRKHGAVLHSESLDLGYRLVTTA